MQISVEKLRALGFHRAQHAPHVVGLRQVTVLRSMSIERDEKMRFAGRQRQCRVGAQHVLQQGCAGPGGADDEDRAFVG